MSSAAVVIGALRVNTYLQHWYIGAASIMLYREQNLKRIEYNKWCITSLANMEKLP